MLEGKALERKCNKMQPRNEKGQTLEEFLAAYDENKYRRPSVTADIAVFTLVRAPGGRHEIAVLLVRRKDHPFIGTWALPGGFVNMDEELHEAAARELVEETGIPNLPLRQFGAFGGVNRDPRTRIITIGHYALAPYETLQIQAGDDAADAAQFRVSMMREAVTSHAALYKMRLSGTCELFTRARLAWDDLGTDAMQMPGGDLASDHGLILFHALLSLAQLPRARAAKLLAGDNAGLRASARHALDKLFCDLGSPGR